MSATSDFDVAEREACTLRAGDGAEVAVPLVSPARVLTKGLLLLALAVFGVVVYRVTPLAGWLAPAGALAERIDALGAVGALAFVLAMAACVLVGVPRLLFCPLAGAIYGFWGGLGLSIAGTMASYYTAFLFLRGRWSGSRPRLALHPKLRFLEHDPGLGGVVVARLLPLPGMVSTVGLSLSGVGHRIYLAGSLVGLVPEAAPLVLLGTGALQTDPRQIAQLAVAGLVCVMAAWLLLRHLVRRRARAAAVLPRVTPSV